MSEEPRRTVYKDGFFMPPDSSFWHFVIEVNGHRIKRSARTGSLREAKRVRADERAKFRSAQPARRERHQGSLAELGAKDVVRAVAEGTTEKQQKGLEYLWGVICKFFGPTAHPRVITYDSTVRFLAANRLVIDPVTRKRKGLAGQSLRRCLQAMKRGCDNAVELGWLAQAPRRWPSVSSDPVKADQAGKLHPPEVLRDWLNALTLHSKARDVARLYYTAGLRRSEMARVSLEWVHMLPRPIAKEGVTFVAALRAPDWATKSRKVREVLIDQESVDAIRRQAAALPGTIPEIERQVLPCMVGHFRKVWKSTATAIGYKAKITPRDLRHCCRTYGGGGDAAQHALGHSDARTSAIYDHPFLDRLASFGSGVHAAVFKSTPAHPPQEPINPLDGRGSGIRTHGPLLPKQNDALAEHLTSCIYCRGVVAGHIELQRVAGGSNPSAPTQSQDATDPAKSEAAS
jgi:integrase